jgi:hypothetical protein
MVDGHPSSWQAKGPWSTHVIGIAQPDVMKSCMKSHLPHEIEIAKF